MSIFTKIPIKRPKLTLFQLNNSVKGTTQFGYEMPLRCEKVVPGDIANIQLAHRLDTAPLSTKLLQEFRNKTETFYVPTRILWKQFEEFFVAEDTSIIHPYFDTFQTFMHFRSLCSSLFTNYNSGTVATTIQMAAFGPKSLLHSIYGFVYPYTTRQDNSLRLDFLKIFAYYFVMREYYLDENLQEVYINALDPEILKANYEANAGDMSYYMAFLLFLPLAMAYDIPIVDNIDYDLKDKTMPFVQSVHPYYLRGFMLRNYPKDYFTSALPWKQKGNIVMLPTSSQSEVQFYVQNDVVTSDGTQGANHLLRFQNNSAAPAFAGYKGVNLIAHGMNNEDNGYIKTLTGIGHGVTSVEDFMTAYELQRWLEKNARGGTRYKEQILSHFGVKTKDSRLDRPEFICGTTDVINLSNVHTTFQDEEGSGVPGESVTVLNGYGRSKNVSYRVTEHGYIFTIACTFPKASYNQGVFRQGLELDKFDYFWPEFEHLGEQEILNCELAPSSDPMLVFGYTPRYAQYKSRQNEVRGEFATDLLTFTDSRILPVGTALNSQFIQIDAVRNNLNRIFNVVNADYDKIYYDYYVNYNFLRPMSYFGQPRLVL